ncbi:hypothetical protein MSAN_00963000 [Mycena sanguinolenta]|uniref:DUF5648 domain-containing protein n=1 Tax=Mycena sanguinolenta TaxID=230812 RepID=A0A8H6YTS6_9AGAR|nr:hypothetical protein MSAN_00963000 [Mycena sanguinolenta]
MKFFFFCLAYYRYCHLGGGCTFSQIAALYARLTRPTPNQTAQCPSYPTITPLFRTYSAVDNDHFYTSIPSEVIAAANEGGQYSLEGVAASIFPTQITLSTPLFRLFKGAVTDHAYTTSAVEVDTLEAEGYVLEVEIPGYVYTTQICNSVPLYGLFSVSGQDHFMTSSVILNSTYFFGANYDMSSASTSERAAAIAGGYTDQGIVAYVPARGSVFDAPSC